MRKTSLVYFLTSLIIITAVLVSCIDPDYFTVYSGKNLIGHTELSEWNITQSATYMTYEAVAAAVAGTSGLPDTSALIYRLENKNLVPYGDFEGVGTLAAAGWDDTNGGTDTIAAGGHPMTGQALSFNLTDTQYIEYDFNQLSDSPSAGSLYTYRYILSGADEKAYYFEIDDTSAGDNLTQYYASIPVINTAYNVPLDFNEHKLTEFLIHSGESEVFRINFKEEGAPQTGFIDNFRVVKSDQLQETAIDIPFSDNNRIDSLDLISGTYRFSIYIKADPELATRNNSFFADAVTLKIKSFDPDGTGGTTTVSSFDAADYSGFADWTLLYIDAALQINTPTNSTATVIRLSVSPTDATGGAITIDTGSVLISSPALMFSENAVF